MHVIAHLLPGLNVIFVQISIVEAFFFQMFTAFGEYHADSGDFFRNDTAVQFYKANGATQFQHPLATMIFSTPPSRH